MSINVSERFPTRQVLESLVHYHRLVDDNDARVHGMKSFAQQKAAEAADLRVTVEQLTKRAKRAEFLLENIYQSWTWRIGRVVLFPASIVRLIRNKRAGL